MSNLRLITAAALALMATPALAICNLAKPPAQFIGEPKVPYRIAYVDPTGIFSKCGTSPNDAFGGTYVLHGCVRQTSAAGFTIYVRSTAGSGERECIIEHEKAHLRGWAPDHSRKVGWPTYKIDRKYKGPGRAITFGDIAKR